MPGKGKHRRPKTPRFSRSIAVAGTGGAALALPLIGTTGAHAAGTTQSVSAPAAQSPQTPVQKAAAQPDSRPGAYTVKPGDCLFEIAYEHHVAGGWHRLYADNRQAVGDDPSLIHPGLKLAHSSHDARASHSSASQAAPGTGTSGAAGTAASTGFTLPVTGATIGTGYHVAGGMWSSGHHTGVDFVVPTGTPVKAVAAGTVVSAGWGGAYGNQVVIKLHDGHYAQYGHLSRLSVWAGQTVTEGQQVGLSGATGNVTGPHLHFEIRTTPDYGSDIDPVGYLREHGVAVV
ncbi:M23 family metallopeptidase [Streptomyces durhamensis]|uniref:M23 family metallopeptidase n=1 Tax=Streptomyces durhamensis TaxID=68194 RepID=UPI0004CD1E6F|nr:LysM peptidoglycan-binding domain-containing M23 family metallopeptidase [Streptomyces durhamensis]